MSSGEHGGYEQRDNATVADHRPQKRGIMDRLSSASWGKVVAKMAGVLDPAASAVPDEQRSGYYANNGNDWPDQISGEASLGEVVAVLKRFPDVYDNAIKDLGSGGSESGA